MAPRILVLTVTFFLAAAADEEQGAEASPEAVVVDDESMFELPVVAAVTLPSELVTTADEAIAATAADCVIWLFEADDGGPIADVVVAFALAVSPLANASLDANVCSSSMCSTRQYSLHSSLAFIFLSACKRRL